jgi:23S rRNA (cytidine1920-2'-O)/16S rRNA (cytidine1409-2'-O)-methyltransferase
MGKDRADKLLHQQGLFESRKKAQIAIEKGLVFLLRNEKQQQIHKVSELVDWCEGDRWHILENIEFAYVSRAGAKIHNAIEHFKIDVRGKNCLDVGLSTGGFSDCLIQKGARWVLGVDVGQGQLHSKLAHVSQLMAFEKINAREPIPKELISRFEARTGAQRFDLMVCDVSFISVIKVLTPQLQYLQPEGQLLILFKPQFEVGPEFIQKKGLVAKDEGLRVLQKTVKTIEELSPLVSLKVIGTVEASPKGEDGNQEYFIYAVKKTDIKIS